MNKIHPDGYTIGTVANMQQALAWLDSIDILEWEHVVHRHEAYSVVDDHGKVLLSRNIYHCLEAHMRTCCKGKTYRTNWFTYCWRQSKGAYFINGQKFQSTSDIGAYIFNHLSQLLVNRCNWSDINMQEFALDG